MLCESEGLKQTLACIWLSPAERATLEGLVPGQNHLRATSVSVSTLDAVRLFDKSKVVRAGFGDAFVASYVKLKLAPIS